MDIPELRAQLDQVDKDLVRLAAERQRIVAEIGRSKRGSGRPLRDFRREKEVLDNVRGHAREAGIDPELAAGLMQLLINASLARQEQDTVRALSQGGGRRALVIGGSGRMGAWFARFLDAQGFQVEVADPVANAAGFAQRERWDQGGLEHDLIVVATPLRAALRLDHAVGRAHPDFAAVLPETPLLRALKFAEPQALPEQRIVRAGAFVLGQQPIVPQAAQIARRITHHLQITRIGVDDLAVQRQFNAGVRLIESVERSRRAGAPGPKPH